MDAVAMDAVATNLVSIMDAAAMDAAATDSAMTDNMCKKETNLQLFFTASNDAILHVVCFG